MDPEATLRMIGELINEDEGEGQWAAALDSLEDYWTSRARGGFQPASGDNRARAYFQSMPAFVRCSRQGRRVSALSDREE